MILVIPVHTIVPNMIHYVYYGTLNNTSKTKIFKQYCYDCCINDIDINLVPSEFVHYINTYKVFNTNASMILYDNNNRWTEFF